MPLSLVRGSVIGWFAIALVAALGAATYGATRANPAAEITPAEALKHWQTSRAKLAAAPDDKQAVLQAAKAADLLERDPAAASAAIRAYRELSAVLSHSHDDAIVAQGKKFAGVARRLGLVGHHMKIVGATVDGEPFDSSTLEGKVVLVDFWATWCGPCRKELPNVKRNYARFHSRGFEVVGVSLDTDADALRDFLGKEQIRWPVLVGQEETGAGWDMPLAIYYGVVSVPTAILIDQRGQVVSLNARGPELTRRLEEMLGK
jgi:thiol-disulfide isomerase/thioredoxin